MRKCLFLAIAGTLLFVGSAVAAETGPGCGLGKLVFDGKKGILFHTLAWTTNGTLSNQTFGITSGTLGCDADAVILREKEQEVFVAANFERLSQDMAQGRGQYVDAMANLMGCGPAVRTDFARMSQERYDAIFTPTADTMSVLASVKREVAAHPALASSCTRVS